MQICSLKKALPQSQELLPSPCLAVHHWGSSLGLSVCKLLVDDELAVAAQENAALFLLSVGQCKALCA